MAPERLFFTTKRFHEEDCFVTIPSVEEDAFPCKEKNRARMEIFEVGCAIVYKEGKLLIAQRHLQDSFGGFWEFPGGKREEGETLEQCLKREVDEELGVRICPRGLLRRKDIEHSGKKLFLFFYFCEWESGEPQALDCKDFKWVAREDVRQYTFLPGDLEVLKDLELHWDEYFKTGKNSR